MRVASLRWPTARAMRSADSFTSGPQVGFMRSAGEEIDNHILPWDEALAMVQRGEIEDGKTVAALLYVDRFRKNAVLSR